MAFRKMYEALGVKDIDRILPPPAPNAPKDPSLEHIDALGGKPFQAFPGQDHRAHVTAHLNLCQRTWLETIHGDGSITKEYIRAISALMATETGTIRIQRNSFMQIQQMQQQAAANPQNSATATTDHSRRLKQEKPQLIAEMD
jgi:hypothetical protein